MKQIKKQGFTLVEIMIVVAIIGLLAAIGVPSIMQAYNTSQQKAMAANVKAVEDAKGRLTLPEDSVDGAAGLTETQVDDATEADLDLNTGDYFDEMAAGMRIDTNTYSSISAALKVGNYTLSVGDFSTKASYTAD